MHKVSPTIASGALAPLLIPPLSWLPLSQGERERERRAHREEDRIDSLGYNPSRRYRRWYRPSRGTKINYQLSSFDVTANLTQSYYPQESIGCTIIYEYPHKRISVWTSDWIFSKSFQVYQYVQFSNKFSPRDILKFWWTWISISEASIKYTRSVNFVCILLSSVLIQWLASIINSGISRVHELSKNLFPFIFLSIITGFSWKNTCDGAFGKK